MSGTGIASCVGCIVIVRDELKSPCRAPHPAIIALLLWPLFLVYVAAVIFITAAPGIFATWLLLETTGSLLARLGLSPSSPPPISLLHLFLLAALTLHLIDAIFGRKASKSALVASVVTFLLISGLALITHQYDKGHLDRGFALGYLLTMCLVNLNAILLISRCLKSCSGPTASPKPLSNPSE